MKFKLIAALTTLALLSGCSSNEPKRYTEKNAEGLPLICNDVKKLRGSYYPTTDLSYIFNDYYAQTKGRKLAVFMDGTGNTRKTHSNVWQMYTMAVEQACAGSPVIPYYEEGVGTQWYDKIVGGAIGKGIGLNIRRGYRFIASNYRDQDEIFIFGFSRGAFTARSLNGMIEYAGLLKIDSIKPHWYDKLLRFLGASSLHWTVEDIYKLYNVHNSGKPGFDQQLRIDIAKGIKELGVTTHENAPVVTAIGVFDTVPALGVERKVRPDNHRLGLYAKSGFHAMSVDEQRYDFQVHRFVDPIKDDQQLNEVWFAGVHANVGGGYVSNHNGLASVSRHWMLDNFAPYGLFPKHDDLLTCAKNEPQCAGGHLNDEFFDNAKLFKPFGIFRRDPVDGDTLHGSIACRLSIDPLLAPHPDREPNGVYEPINLKRPLSEHYKMLDYDCKEGKTDAE